MSRIRLKELIAEAKERGVKVTQRDIARRLGLAVSSINQIVHGKTKAPDPSILLGIADYFTEKLGRPVTLDELVQRDPLEAAQASIKQTADKFYEASDKVVEPARKAATQALEATRKSLEKLPGSVSGHQDDGGTEISTEEMARRMGVKVRPLDPDKDFVTLPLYGTVPCGDLEAIDGEHIDDWFTLPRMVGVKEGMFLLRAVGDSMEPEIPEGAFLVIQPGKWTHNDIVVAWVDNGDDTGVTCKRLHQSEGYALLVSTNPKYPPLPVTGSVRIFGRVATYFVMRRP